MDVHRKGEYKKQNQNCNKDSSATGKADRLSGLFNRKFHYSKYKEINMRVVIQENYDKMSKWAADYIANKINSHKEDRPFVLGLATGSSPIGVYNELVKKYKAGELSFKNVVTFNMDEYLL